MRIPMFVSYGEYKSAPTWQCPWCWRDGFECPCNPLGEHSGVYDLGGQAQGRSVETNDNGKEGGTQAGDDAEAFPWEDIPGTSYFTVCPIGEAPRTCEVQGGAVLTGALRAPVWVTPIWNGC